MWFRAFQRGSIMDVQSVKILGVRIDKVNTEEAYDNFLSLFNEANCSAIYTPNPEIIMKATEDEELRRAISDAGLVIPDGIGVIYASKIQKLGLEERVPGIEFMERILTFCNNSGRSIFLLGGKPDVAKKAGEEIVKKFPKIEVKGYQDGYFADNEELKIIDKINEVKPDILFVAMGAPKQEKWINKHKKILNTRIAMGVGGSLDVWAGYAKRAPKLFIDLNLEWLYRIMTNPSRIGRALLLPKFMIAVFLENMKLK